MVRSGEKGRPRLWGIRRLRFGNMEEELPMRDSKASRTYWLALQEMLVDVGWVLLN